jgi:hypothetical protein
MSAKFRNRVIELSTLLLLGVAAVLAMPSGYAAMIPTEAVQAPDGERERVKAMLARPEVAAEMQKMGIAPADAARRVDAMTDAEVRTLAGRFDALPAGGALSNTDVLVIILLVLLIIIIL